MSLEQRWEITVELYVQHWNTDKSCSIKILLSVMPLCITPKCICTNRETFDKWNSIFSYLTITEPWVWLHSHDKCDIDTKMCNTHVRTYIPSIAIYFLWYICLTPTCICTISLPFDDWTDIFWGFDFGFIAYYERCTIKIKSYVVYDFKMQLQHKIITFWNIIV